VTRSKALAILVIVLALSAGYADVRVFQLGKQIGGDENQTCLIQARGLPAGHYLAASMNGIHALLTLPRSPREPSVPPRIQRIVQALNKNLAQYQKAEASQPRSRSCS
jgi:hypothetical protein